MQVTDREILEIFRKDQEAGIRELFSRYYKPLVLFADEYVKDINLAEDLVQEFFVRLCENKYLKEISAQALSSYLFTAVRNSSIKHIGKKDVLKERADIGFIDVPEECFLPIDEPEMNQVMREMDNLPEQTRKVVEGIVIKELKYKEVASELNISVNTVKTLLHRGMRRLQNSLSNCKKQIYYFFFKKIL